MKVRQVAERSGVTAASVRKWLRSGRLHGVRPTGQWFVDPGDLDAFLGARPINARETPDERIARIESGDVR